MLTKFNLFLESTFRRPRKRRCDYGDRVYEKPNGFDMDTNIINHIYLEKYHKNIDVLWYDNADINHCMKDRVDKRTSAESVSEFNNIVNDKLIELFDNNLDELDVKMTIEDINKIAVKIDLKSYLIITYEPDKLYDDDFYVFVTTIVPYLKGISRINRIFN